MKRRTRPPAAAAAAAAAAHPFDALQRLNRCELMWYAGLRIIEA